VQREPDQGVEDRFWHGADACGQFEANAVFLRIGVLAYNVGRLFVLQALDVGWHRHQVQMLR